MVNGRVLRETLPTVADVAPVDTNVLRHLKVHGSWLHQVISYDALAGACMNWFQTTDLFVQDALVLDPNNLLTG